MMKMEGDKLGRLQRLSRLIALLSFAAFVVLIAFSAWQLRNLKQGINNAQNDLLKKEEEIGEKEKRIKELDAMIEAKEGEIKVRNTIINNTPDLEPIIKKVIQNDPKAAKSLPRIYLHILDESQREGAKALTAKLQAGGYVVPGIENVGNKPVREIQLRYCENRGLQSDVDNIIGLLAGEGVTVAKPIVMNLPACQNVSSSRSYELWLGQSFKGQK